MPDDTHPGQSGNKLLNLLPPDVFQELSPHIELVQLSNRDTVFKREREFRYVYFPISSVVSVIMPFRNGNAVEVATVGNEGFACCDALIGGDVAWENFICQLRGQSARMRIATFQEAVAGDTPLRRITQQYMRVYLSQIAQTAACNRLHSTEERFARWTLVMRDRAGSDQFSLNDEFLGYMLGEPRSVVRLVTRTFEHAGLLQYQEGYIKLLNVPEIEGISCECHQAIKKLHQQMLQGEWA
jgi:CRP-like cAMP-binding protein